MKQTLSSEIRISSYLSVVILAMIFLGFYRTYFMFFPNFENFVFVQHFHGVVMLFWMSCLIAQPLLIERKKYEVHKAIGKFSYILAPVLAFSIFMVTRMGYRISINSGIPEAEAIAQIALSTPLLIAFVIFYSLAIANKTNMQAHMRYMIGTALLMIGPGRESLLNLFRDALRPDNPDHKSYCHFVGSCISCD